MWLKLNIYIKILNSFQSLPFTIKYISKPNGRQPRYCCVCSYTCLEHKIIFLWLIFLHKGNEHLCDFCHAFSSIKLESLPYNHIDHPTLTLNYTRPISTNDTFLESSGKDLSIPTYFNTTPISPIPWDFHTSVISKVL